MKILFNDKKEPNLSKGVVLVRFGEGDMTEVERGADGRKSIVIGLGKKRAEVDVRKLHSLARQIIATARAHKIKEIAIDRDAFAFVRVRLSDAELGELLASNFEMADFEFIAYKSRPKDGWNFMETITITGKANAAFKKGIERGQLIGREVNLVRDLANTPGGDMTPEKLAQAAREAVKGTRASTKVLDVEAMEKLGMGAVLGVAAGSADAPCFIIVEYWGAGPAPRKATQGNQNNRPIVLVGKGVTFDTGGLNLKSSEAMYEMHMDMSGGAAVIHIVALAARLGLKKNIIGLVPAVENMPSGSSYHPGDVLRSMSGKTIEILNTDAEGRVILADALFYAGKMYNPKLVVDVATLTGAAMVALGNKASAIFTKDTKLENDVRRLGEASGDYVWPLPLWDEYEADIKGTFGDWANMGKTRYGGAISGAKFLEQFTKDYPKETKWLHVDIAPRMTSYEGEYLAKGAVGTPVRLLLKLLEQK